MSRAEEIRARLEAATPGPWRHRRDGDTGYLVEAHLPCINGLSAWFTVSVVWHPTTAEIGYTDGAIWDAEDSAALIANAPADLAWLIGEVEREKARADAAEAALATADAAGFARGVEAAAEWCEASRAELSALDDLSWYDDGRQAAFGLARDAIRALVPS